MKKGIYYHPETLEMIEVYSKSHILRGYYRIWFLKKGKPQNTLTTNKLLKAVNYRFLGEVES